MDLLVTVLLIVALVKFVIIAAILLVVFKPDIRQMREKRKVSSVPACIYCRSKWTKRLDEGQTRWDHDDLVLVTSYECEHCRLPFWHVERLKTASPKR